MSPTDDTLLQRVTRGDADALELLYERHGTALERQTTPAAHGARQRYCRRSPAGGLSAGLGARRTVFGQWHGSLLGRIASNLALNHLDAVKRRRQQSLEPLADDDGDSPLPAWLVDEAAIAPDAALKKLELQRLVRGVVDTLLENKRRVVNLVYDANLEISAVAEKLGVPPRRRWSGVAGTTTNATVADPPRCGRDPVDPGRR